MRKKFLSRYQGLRWGTYLFCLEMYVHIIGEKNKKCTRSLRNKPGTKLLYSCKFMGQEYLFYQLDIFPFPGNL